MSPADHLTLAGPAPPVTASRNPARTWFRFFVAELRLVFGRRRNLLLLAVTVVFPIVIGIALRVTAPHPQGGNGPGVAFFNQLAGNGVFLTFIALSTLLVLVLPVVVSVVAGDSVAGEAGYGTLRYLLAVPAGRTRLLGVKLAAVIAFGLCATLIVSATSLVAGAVLFPVGPVTLLSGVTVPLAEGLLRVLFVTLYVAAAMAALGAIGLAPAQGPVVVRCVHGPGQFPGLGPLHLGRRHQLSFRPAAGSLTSASDTLLRLSCNNF